MKNKFTVNSILGLAGIVVIAGCGGSQPLRGTSSVGAGAKPRVRVVDALTNPAAVSVDVAGSSVIGVSRFGGVSTYQAFNAGNDSVIFNNSTQNSILLNQSLPFQFNASYTVIGYQSANGPALMQLSDINQPNSALTSIRFTKVGGNSTQTVDLYITDLGDSIDDLGPAFLAVPLGSDSQRYVTLNFGTYEITETATGSKVPLIHETIDFGGGSATTILDDGTNTFLTLQDQ